MLLLLLPLLRLLTSSFPCSILTRPKRPPQSDLQSSNLTSGLVAPASNAYSRTSLSLLPKSFLSSNITRLPLTEITHYLVAEGSHTGIFLAVTSSLAGALHKGASRRIAIVRFKLLGSCEPK
ncbi:uncharacterized protein CCOS01_01372 [Colletotrichum costaricense]|uniref:Uncharacterized protein n=2 Tax=Colletotrichum acutatum species complex TaxID=2707335 RepID=A0AAI9ZAT2_9PEZI|nr:uncharacterized protein CCOS01_01372 [Colletotrichum costaricense]XP_060382466.1 uncharacterized protein CTAM01_06939 [Colletotrichum tamarilloi]KAK1499745.1 hypothetical protein CTAM01_06939 [Colletotrichum tamarilloi]KAK1540058.1 hypothetical protein CCOS01_01372 [Colletotrichum costaricense]